MCKFVVSCITVVVVFSVVSPALSVRLKPTYRNNRSLKENNNNTAAGCTATSFILPADNGMAAGNAQVSKFLSTVIDEDEEDAIPAAAAATEIIKLAVPLGVHGTDMEGIKSIIQDGITLNPVSSSSGYQLLGPGFYMYSFAFGTGINGAGIKAKLAHYAGLASKKHSKSPKVFAIFGAPESILSTLSGVDVSGCAAEYMQALGSHGNAHKLNFDAMNADFVVSPAVNGAVELVARQGLASLLQVLAVVSYEDETILCLGSSCSGQAGGENLAWLK
mmetsp:Transcript_84360/g.131738  ORF Transcript_84360/g.131738 Transcript_84360/m.131738 type:complete len:276 (+) Transcript_84360:43-870(+)